MENHEQQYAKGFNNGYLIAAYEPDLFSSLIKSIETKTEYLQGFIFGGKEFEHEREISIKPQRHQQKEKDRGREIDHDR